MAKGLELPDEIPEDYELELYKGRWAVRIKGNLYVFPEETTRGQAEDVLRRAIHLYKTGMN